MGGRVAWHGMVGIGWVVWGGLGSMGRDDGMGGMGYVVWDRWCGAR